MFNDNLAVVLVAVCAAAGGILAAFLGFLKSSEPFEPKKFLASVLTSVISGIVFGVGYQIAGRPDIKDFFMAFLGGAGIDALRNYSGAFKK